MRTVRWLGFIGGLVVVVALMVFLGRPDNSSETVAGVNEVTARDHVQGNPNAAVTLVEYSDFQCPACAAYEPTLRRIVAEHKDALRFVYRHFPLMGHQHADLAARASEAAAQQGKFWEMHGLLFENQSSWSVQKNPKDTFIGYARQLGLDEKKFADMLTADVVEDKVAADLMSGNRARVDATPTFFLNGMRIKPSSDYASFNSIISSAIRASAASATSTTTSTP